MEKFFNALLEMVQNGATFIQGQLPDYVNQLLTFKFWQILTGIGVWALCLTATLLFLIFILKKVKEEIKEDGELEGTTITGAFVCGMFLFILLMVGLCSGPDAISDLVKIKLAPKVFVVDYLKDMLKK